MRAQKLPTRRTRARYLSRSTSKTWHRPIEAHQQTLQQQDQVGQQRQQAAQAQQAAQQPQGTQNPGNEIKLHR